MCQMWPGLSLCRGKKTGSEVDVQLVPLHWREAWWFGPRDPAGPPQLEGITVSVLAELCLGCAPTGRQGTSQWGGPSPGP